MNQRKQVIPKIDIEELLEELSEALEEVENLNKYLFFKVQYGDCDVAKLANMISVAQHEKDLLLQKIANCEK